MFPDLAATRGSRVDMPVPLFAHSVVRHVGRGESMSGDEHAATRILVVDDHDLIAETLRRAPIPGA
jgi:hypothetical protein